MFNVFSYSLKLQAIATMFCNSGSSLIDKFEHAFSSAGLCKFADACCLPATGKLPTSVELSGLCALKIIFP
jgi:hypothetical protein|tara:strand:+ start:189 stop:401 length:213 start_codon:yes stop_codon:yes gene_type:complete